MNVVQRSGPSFQVNRRVKINRDIRSIWLHVNSEFYGGGTHADSSVEVAYDAEIWTNTHREAKYESYLEFGFDAIDSYLASENVSWVKWTETFVIPWFRVEQATEGLCSLHMSESQSPSVVDSGHCRSIKSFKKCLGWRRHFWKDVPRLSDKVFENPSCFLLRLHHHRNPAYFSLPQSHSAPFILATLAVIRKMAVCTYQRKHSIKSADLKINRPVLALTRNKYCHTYLSWII